MYGPPRVCNGRVEGGQGVGCRPVSGLWWGACGSQALMGSAHTGLIISAVSLHPGLVPAWGVEVRPVLPSFSTGGRPDRPVEDAPRRIGDDSTGWKSVRCPGACAAEKFEEGFPPLQGQNRATIGMKDPHDLISRRCFRIISHLYLLEGFCGAGSWHHAPAVRPHRAAPSPRWPCGAEHDAPPVPGAPAPWSWPVRPARARRAGRPWSRRPSRVKWPRRGSEALA